MAASNELKTPNKMKTIYLFTDPTTGQKTTTNDRDLAILTAGIVNVAEIPHIEVIHHEIESEGEGDESIIKAIFVTNNETHPDFGFVPFFTQETVMSHPEGNEPDVWEVERILCGSGCYEEMLDAQVLSDELYKEIIHEADRICDRMNEKLTNN